MCLEIIKIGNLYKDCNCLILNKKVIKELKQQLKQNIFGIDKLKFNKNCNEYYNNYKNEDIFLYSNHSFILFLSDQDIEIVYTTELTNFNMKCKIGTLLIYNSQISKVKIINKVNYSLSGNVINSYNRDSLVLWG